MFIDTHAHYDDAAFAEDRDSILNKVHTSGCIAIVNAAQDIASAEFSVKMAANYSYVYAAVGIHPHNAAACTTASMGKIEKLADHPKVVAIGETGLDYHYNFCSRELQAHNFRQHIRLAKKIGKPVVVHDREAHEDTLRILKEEDAASCGCVIHCFSGSAEMGAEIIQRGYLVSLGGAVTFKNARRIIEALHILPLDKIMLETDCPYMTPEPFRGRRNDSGNIPLIAQKIADIKGEKLEKILAITSENAANFFHIQMG